MILLPNLLFTPKGLKIQLVDSTAGEKIHKLTKIYKFSGLAKCRIIFVRNKPTKSHETLMKNS